VAELHLSERQQATVAFAITLFCGVVIVTFVGFVFWLIGAMIQRFSAVLLPLAVAGILAVMLKPYHQWLTRKFGGRGLPAVIVVFLSALIPLSVFCAVFGAKIVLECADFVKSVPDWWKAVEAKLAVHWPALESFWLEHHISERLREALAEHSASIARGVTGLSEQFIAAWSRVFRSIAGLLSWVVFPVYLGFFLLGRPLSKDRLEAGLPFLKAATRKDVSYLAFEFVDIMVSFFRGQILIGFLQGILYAIGFSLIGLEYGFTLGLTLGFLNIIPYLGSMVGLSVALPLAFLQDGGGAVQVVLALAVFTVVQCIEGYFLTPRIMGERTGLHPMMIIVAIFFWGSVFGGITGMIMAIPLTAFLVVVWRLLKAKYITEIL